MLKRAGIIHTVLNAKFHQQEAEIVTRAGQRGAVTIATNMAGRGTDIKLGEGVRELGGLYVIGTERHESRRIDRQLRGRCSRQGDPGPDQVLPLARGRPHAALPPGQPRLADHGGLDEGGRGARAPAGSTARSSPRRKRSSSRTSPIRKRLLQYDDVLNQQREVIYGIRNGAIHADRAEGHHLRAGRGGDREPPRESPASAKRAAPTPPAVESLVGWLNSHFPISLKVEELTGDDADALLKSRRRAHQARPTR